MRRAAKRDDNERQIVDALRGIGAAVTQVDAKGVPDLLVSYRGHWCVLEVKDGNKPPSRQRLTPEQEAWRDQQRAPVPVVTTVEDAIAWVIQMCDTGSA